MRLRDMSLAAALLAGCGSNEGRSSATAAPTSSPAPVAAAAAAPPPPPPPAIPQVVHAQHMASFTSERLQHCSDFTIVLRPGPARHEPWPPEGWPPQRIPPGAEEIEIPQDCEKQFADRTVYATCTHRTDETSDTLEKHAMGLQSFYSGVVYTTDAWMTQCMREGGTWWRMDENDSRAQMARAEYQLAESQDELRRLQERRR
jgi:hypothetical protein